MAETLRVLYVDDEPGLLEIAKLFMEMAGDFSVITVESATGALALLKSEQFDAIIADYQMPVMDGIELLKIVRASGNTIPFIIFTGKSREEIVIQALNEGADFYLQKGGEPNSQFAELQHKVRMAVQRRTAEASLVKSKEQHLEILRTAMDGYMLLDTEGHILEVNTAYSRMSGYSQQELLLMRISDLEATESTEDSTIHFQNVITQGQARFESHHRRKDGSTFNIEINAHSLPDDGGRIIAFLNDITERKKKEEEMIFKNAILSTQAETSLDGILIVDDAGKILRFNQKFINIWGIPPGLEKSTDDEPMLHHVEEQLTDPEAFLSRVRYLYAHNQEKSFEELRLRDGRILERFSAPMFAEPGKYYGRVWYFRDITGRKQAEEALRETSARLTFALQSAKAGTWDWDFPTGRLVWSPEFFELFGISPDIMASFDVWLDHLHPDDRTIALEQINQSVAEHRDLWNEYRVLLPDGSVRWIGASGSTTYNDSGEPLRMSGVCIDITERKSSEEEVLRKNEQLNSAYEELLSGEEELRQNYKELALNQQLLEESEQKYRLVADNSDDWIYWVNPEGKFRYLSPSCERVTGYSVAEFHDNPELIKEIVLPADQEIFNRHSLQILEEKEPDYLEFRIITKNGMERWIGHSCNPVYTTDGQYAGRRGTNRNITERKRAEDGLRVSEARLRAILDATPFPIAVVDVSDNNIEFWSRSALSLFGHTAPSAPEWYQIAYPDPDYRGNVIARWKPFLEKAKITGETVNTGEYRVTCRDGSVRICELYASFLPDKLIVTFNDVTERKRAEEALRESEETFKALAENANEGILVAVTAETHTYANRRAGEILGYSVAELLSCSIKELAVPDTAGTLQDRFRMRLFGEDIPQQYETSLRHKAGTLIPVEISAAKTFWHGQPADLVIIHDISERKRTEDSIRNLLLEVRLEKDRLASLINSISDEIWFADTSKTFTLANPQALMEFRLDSGETDIEKLAADLEVYRRDGSPRPVEETPPLCALQGEVVKNREEIVRIPRSGELRYRQVSSNPVRDASGDIIGSVSVVRDITERVHIEEALAAANRKLTLLSGITRHDINNQLLTLNGFVGLLHKQVPDPALEDFFIRISKVSDRISAMIRFTKEYEDIGVHAPAWQETRSLVETAAKQAMPGKVMVKNNLPAGAEVFADPLIEKVFYNLVDNAVRYGGKITTIRFSAEVHDGNQTVVCEDDGYGIPVEEKEQIFERGFGKNTGLGLTLSREILEITDITIRETGVPGKGARFEISVPEGAWRIMENPI
jgi:PAS domain S-box-containing protein